MVSQLLKWLVPVLGLISVGAAMSQSNSALGYWTTIDDETKKPRAVVQISEKQGILEGRILKVYHQQSDHDVCVKCKGELKNAPIVGLRFVWGMKPDGSKEWASGKILDPKSGKIYKCKMTLDRTGQKMKVRGYIGISLFGRTQLWIRRAKP